MSLRDEASVRPRIYDAEPIMEQNDHAVLQPTRLANEDRLAKRAQTKAQLMDQLLRNPHLPSPPALALQIIEKTSHEDCGTKELVHLLSQDPVLCGKLLKTVNSALFGRSHPVASLDRAVAILGRNPLRSLVLSLVLPIVQSRVQVDDGMRAYWRSSLAGAMMARELARRSGMPAPEDDFVAGLLRDVGMILLRQHFEEEYQSVWQGSRGLLAQQQCNWEERHLGIQHADVSAAFLAGWKLPDEIVVPIRFHHHPYALKESRPALGERATLLDWSGRLAQLEELTTDTSLLHELLSAVKDEFRLDRASLLTLLSAVSTQMDEFATILNVDVGSCPGFDDVLAAGCDELVRLSAINLAGNLYQEPLTSRPPAGPEPASGELHPDLLATMCLGPSAEGQQNVRSDGRIPRLTDEVLHELEHKGGDYRVQHYHLESLLGRGTMGIVLKAYDPELNRRVALKFLAPDLVSRPWALQRFQLEAEVSSSIHQENVVGVFAVGELSGDPFMVMEYVEGDSLQEHLDRLRRFEASEISRIGRECALGLAAAHAIHVIHRDVKPSNIMLERHSGRARIADFGLARVLDVDLNVSQQGQMVGTPLYMSPEQVDGKRLTPATDLFSFGSVLYVLCTGQLPFDGTTMVSLLNGIALRSPTPIRQLNPAIPQWLSDLVEKLHIKDPEQRMASAAEVAKYLERFSS